MNDAADKPCGACGRRASDMLGDEHCIGCERDALIDMVRRGLTLDPAGIHRMTLTFDGDDLRLLIGMIQ